MITFYLISFLIIFKAMRIKSKKSLHMLQQNLYNENNRYLKWLKYNYKTSYNKIEILSVILLILSCLLGNVVSVVLIIISMLFILFDSEYLKYTIMVEKAKKPLVITARVKRQIVTLYTLNLIPFIIYIFKKDMGSVLVLSSSILLLLNYIIVYLVKVINDPIEKSVYKMYWNKAVNKLKSLNNLKVIGITGSYGKTSSKNVLNEILSIEYITHPTPKNYNTDVGLMSTINNELNKFDEIFIAEMGAYRVGRIKNVCNLVSPKYGLLTTIGKAHLETFGSQENIVNTKFELIESLPSDGIAFLNMDDPLQVGYKLKNKVKVVWYAVDNKDASVYATDIKCSGDGSTFKVYFKDINKMYPFKTKLLGKHNISNILAGIAVGYEFGIMIEKLQSAVSKIQPIEHRLELKKLGLMYQIDDAYNSNPVGAKVALDVLGMMRGTKVVVTPGMVELGSEEEKYNYEFGRQMSKVADYVILVGEKQTKPIYKGLIEEKYKKDNIIVTNDVREAYTLVNKLKGKEDIYALFENDLPDTYRE